MKNVILIIIINPFFLKAQLESLRFDAPIKWDYTNFNKSRLIIGIDTMNYETISINNEYYIRKSIKGDTTELLILDNCFVDYCGDEGIHLSGEYSSFFDDKKIKEFGRIKCNFKCNEWVYFYQDGSLKKYENFQNFPLLYSNERFFERSGHYAEYFQNGNIKLIGSYKLIEKYDKYEYYNAETYNVDTTCCEWMVVSIKDGYWYEYAEDGALISKINCSIDLSNNRDYRERSEGLRIEYKNGNR